MKTNTLKFSLALAFSFTLIGCTTTPKTQIIYSDESSKLSKIETANGGQAFVWVDPNVKMNNYKTLQYTPIQYDAAIKPNNNISQDVLQQVLDYTNTQVAHDLSKSYTLVKQNPDLEFKGTFTQFNASTKPLKPYEALPILLIFSGGKYLAGQRELNTNMLFEGQFIDKKTNRTVIKYVQRIRGSDLENKKSELTIDSVKTAIHHFSTDLTSVAK